MGVIKDMGLFGTDGEKGSGRVSATGVFTALLLFAALVAGCEGKSEDLGKDVLATVGGDPVTVDDYRSWVGSDMPDKLEDRRLPLDLIINQRLTSRAALDNGMLADPGVASQLDMFYNGKLPGLLRKKVAEETTVTDAEVAASIKDVKPSLQVSIIVAPTLNDAQAAMAELKKGADFEQVAKKRSSMSTNTDRVIDLDDALYPLGVRAVLNGLKPGEVSPAMKMDVGYMIFKLKARLEPEDIKKAAEKDARVKVMDDKVERNMAEILDRLQRKASIKLDTRVSPSGEMQYLGAVVNGTTISMDPKLFGGPHDPHAPHENMNTKTLQDALRGAINNMLLASEAKRRGLQYDPAFQKALAQKKVEILADAYIARVRDSVVMSPQDIQDYYNKNKAMFASQPQVRLSRILLPTEAEAEAALAELKPGRQFADVARERSTDPTAKQNGGDVGYLVLDDLKEPLRSVIGRLKAGEHTGVMKTEYGFEIIMVTEVKPSAVPEMSALSDTIGKRVLLHKRGDVVGGAYKELRKKYVVKVNDALLKSLK